MTEADTPSPHVPPRDLHVFRVGGEPFLLHTPTSASLRLDAAGEAAARLVLREGWEAARARAAAGGDDVSRALGPLLSLHARGRSPVAERPPSLLPPRRRYVFSVVLSERCNLRCRYCFAGGSRASRTPREMSPAVMAATARFIADHYAGFGVHGFVQVGLTSEPLLLLPQYRQLTDLLAQEGRRVGLLLKAQLNASNLALPELPALLAESPDVCLLSVSIDGPPEIHDAARVYADGRGSYADMRRNLDLLRRQGAAPEAVGATLTGLHPEVTAVYRHLVELGFGQVHVKPVRTDPAAPYAIGRNLEQICAGYEAFAAFLLSLPEEELLRYLLASYSAFDYFGRFLERVTARHRGLYRCPAWLERTAVDVDGTLYACDSLVGNPEARLGSVFDGIDEARVRAMAEELSVLQRKPCRDCWARHICGGGCMYQSFLTHGEFGPPDPSECHLNQRLIELAVAFLAKLRAEHALVAAALPRERKRSLFPETPLVGYWLPRDLDADDRWTRLADRRPTAVLRAATHLRRALVGPDDARAVKVTAGGDADNLYVLLALEGAPAAFSAAFQSVSVQFSAPRGLALDRDRLCPAADGFDVTVVADLGQRLVRYDWAPALEPEGSPVCGANVQAEGPRCRLTLPWRDLHCVAPAGGLPFAFEVMLQEPGGGAWDWHPDGQGTRVALVKRP